MQTVIIDYTMEGFLITIITTVIFLVLADFIIEKQIRKIKEKK